MNSGIMPMIHQHHGNLQDLRPETTAQLPPEQKRHQGEADDAITESACDLVGQPLDGRSPGLCLLNKGNDPGQGCFAADTLNLHLQSGLEIEATGTEFSPWFGLERQRLAGET